MAIDLKRVFASTRPGQRKAIETAVDRIRAGETATSLILPTRYGKTDVARIILAYCIDAGFVAVGLFVTVTELLREQAASIDDWTACFVRYGIGVSLPVRELKFPEARPHKNGERCLVATIQLVERNLDVFVLLADAIWNETGRPLLVFIDECHTGSQANSWGAVATELRKHHCHVVLLTATAIRSDGVLIDGFRCVTLDSQAAAWNTHRTSGDPETVLIDYWKGTRDRVRLIADWETTYQDAWRESPSPLCKISRVPFDVDLMTITEGLTDRERVGWLSEKSADEARGLLGRLVRDVRVIRDGVHRLVRELALFRRIDGTAGAIVYCGNDQESGGAHLDDHVRAVQRELSRQAPHLSAVVATQKQGADAVEIIRRFAKGGVGDVLLVKQMAALGLDAPRLKVCLDLSPVRQDASCLQRWFRVGTPFARFAVAVLIHPADVLGKTIFNAWVEAQGGAQDHRQGAIVATIEVPRKPPPPRRVTLVSGTGPAEFDDTQQHRAEADLQHPAYLLCARFPVLLTEHSHAEIADLTRGISFDAAEVAPAESAVDLTAELEGEQDDVANIVNEIMRAREARKGPVYDQAAYGKAKQDLWIELYRDAGVPYPKGGLRRITDRRLLARLKGMAELMRAREVGDGIAP